MQVPQIDARTSEDGGTYVKRIDDYKNPDFFLFRFNEKKELVNFVKYVERIIRRSYEYREYVKYLRDELNISRCTFLSEIDTHDIKNVDLEFHHYPFTLFDIAMIALNRRLERDEVKISPFDLTNEILELHYENKVGLVPLTETVHELAHSGKIFINLKQVFGDVRGFVERYRLGLTDQYKEQLHRLIALSEKHDANYRPDVLEECVMKLEGKDGKLEKFQVEERKEA